MTSRLASPVVAAISVAAALLVMAANPDAICAQTTDDYVPAARGFESRELFALELRIGPYRPDVGNDSFETTFDDSGPLLGFELDVIAYRVKEIAYLAVGAGVGFASYTGAALDAVYRTETAEEIDFDLYPLSLMAVVRVDALARKLSIPFIFTGKLGHRWAIWDVDKGEAADAEGVSPGLAWAVQVALDLDFFDRRSARLLDEEWGINHTFLFFEIFGSDTSGDAMPVDDTVWAAGLGFVF